MLGSGFDSPQRRWCGYAVPVGLDVLVDLPLQIDGARGAQRAHDHVGAHTAIGGHIATGIREAPIRRIVVDRHPDLLARGGNDVLVAGVREPQANASAAHTAARQHERR